MITMHRISISTFGMTSTGRCGFSGGINAANLVNGGGGVAERRGHILEVVGGSCREARVKPAKNVSLSLRPRTTVTLLQ